MNPTLSALATAVPAFQFSLADAKRCLERVMPLRPERLAAVRAVFDHAGVQRRYSAFPLEYLVTRRPMGQVSREYREQAIGLGRRVAAESLAEAGLDAEQIDLLITVSCTGVMLPSLDAYLINELGFRRDVRRLPITELGCAAGVSALARARDFLLAYPEGRALVVSVEFPSLTFQGGDVSMANLVSCAVFGDGAAAALVAGSGATGVRILDSASHLFPDSYDALGFDLEDGGLHIVLGKQIAALIRAGLYDAVEGLLRRHGLGLNDIGFVVLHPGGKKLIEAAEEVLRLDRAQTQPAWDVLRDFGNLSSAAVFFVLQQWLSRQPQRSGGLGLMVAFGPGFSAELLLLQM
jgi:predicted naringenin-chalcone synthase